MAGGAPAEWANEVDIDQAMQHTAAIAQWVRLSGSDDERKAFDYVDGVLSGYGLETTIYEPTCLVSLPLSGSIQAGDDLPVTGITHAFSVSTGPNGVVGELVFAGGGSEDDFRRAGASGKIALTDGLATPNKAHAATTAGVLAVICISGTPVHEMIVSPVWGSPTTDTLSMVPKVPLVSIDDAQGARLKELLNLDRPVRCRVVTEVDTSWRPIPVLVADLATSDRNYVMFSGHIDSWHYGAMDNGSANATMIETARVLAGHRDALTRGVRFCFWSGHSHARYGGSTWYADTFWFDLRERCVAHVNVDSTGAVGATNLSGANTMADTYGFAREVIQRQTGQELEYRRFGRAGDQSFWGIGLPSLFMSLSQQGVADAATEAQAFLLGGGGPAGGRSGGLGWWWHTTEDTLDKIDPNHLARDIRVYVEVVGTLTTATIVPFDPAAAIAEITSALDEVEPLWDALPSGPFDGVGFDDLREELALAAKAADAFNQRATEADIADGTASAINDRLIEACKLLIPVNYTASDWFEHDLALEAVPLPSLRPAKPVVSMSDDEQWGASHKLRRDINRVRHAIRSARMCLEG